jgi:hypothetical protein
MRKQKKVLSLRLILSNCLNEKKCVLILRCYPLLVLPSETVDIIDVFDFTVPLWSEIATPTITAGTFLRIAQIWVMIFIN